MKICILTHTFPRFKKDVAAPFMDGVAEGIRNAGNEVFVLAPYSPKFKRSKKDQKYKIVTYKYIWPDFLHKLGYSETLNNDMGIKPIVWFLSPFMYVFATIALYRLVKKERIDLINAHWILPNGFIACAVSKLTGTPVISTLPGSDVYMAQKNAIFSWMASFATKMSSAVTSNSPQLLRDMAKIAEKDVTNRKKLEEKFSTIIYGVFPEKFIPSKKNKNRIKRKVGLSDKNSVILGVGRLVAKKGFVYLMKAAPSILKKYRNVKFVLIGEGDQRGELEKLAEKLGVENSFILIGWVDHSRLVDYYNMSDVFILPSIRDDEGNLDDQSVSVVEAMSCGLPVVTSNFPGYKLVVKNGVNGFLVPEKNSAMIAKSLIKLMSSKSLQKKMGRASRAMTIKDFSWTAIGKQYSSLFKKISKPACLS